MQGRLHPCFWSAFVVLRRDAAATRCSTVLVCCSCRVSIPVGCCHASAHRLLLRMQPRSSAPLPQHCAGGLTNGECGWRCRQVMCAVMRASSLPRVTCVSPALLSIELSSSTRMLLRRHPSSCALPFCLACLPACIHVVCRMKAQEAQQHPRAAPGALRWCAACMHLARV